MCGIVGFLGGAVRGEHAVAAVRRMASVLAHRGPDDDGVWSDASAGVALGHRRLAIIDVSPDGHQPKVSPSGRWVVAYNGEIYNYRELRDALAAAGARFDGTSDTAVMLAAFDHWGIETAVRRFAGMFAFAAWDAHERTLHLVRDRVGEKPLYYGVHGGTLLFASELKALAEHPSWRGEVDRGALAAYLRYNYVPGPRSIYRDVRKLPAGSHAVVRAAPSLSLDAVRVTRYWSAEDVARRGATEPMAGDPASLVESLDRLLRGVVRDEMVADVPLGAFLSGGIDSSLIVGLMQAESVRPVRTFTIGFDEGPYDEAGHARAVAAHLGTAHTELYVAPRDMLDVIPHLPALYDEPFADSSQVPTYLVAKLARQHVTVSLSGDGGDELFGGYNRYVWGARLWRRLARIPRAARRMAASAIRAMPPARWDAVYGGLEPAIPGRLRVGAPGPGDRLHKLAGVLDVRSAHELYVRLCTFWDGAQPAVLGASADARGTGAAPGRLPGFVEEMMLLDLETYLPDDVLVKVDRAAMGVSLETRAPFLDHRVVEFAARVPLAFKLRDGGGKWLLRRVLDRYVPPALIDRPKTGFAVPLDRWLRGPLREWAGDLLDPARLRADGFVEPAVVERRWAEHSEGRRNWQHELWGVLMFQAWLHAR